MTREDIKKLIYSKKSDIDNVSLEYFTNYFLVLSNNPQILGSNNIEDLIDNALAFASKVVFYDENSDVYKYYGPDIKGLCNREAKTIYVRNNLGEPLREIIFYHELHHAVQTNPDSLEVGINQVSNFGRMIMEAQTQYFAEKVYQEIHDVSFEERDIPSENVRMLEGGTVCSSMHNYEMYDSIVSKLSIILDVPKDFFVSINYFNRDNIGMNMLRTKYDEAKNKYNFPYEFEDFMYMIDYVYCVDIVAYCGSPQDKQVVLSGGETEGRYQIYSNRNDRLSQQREFDFIDDIDRKYFLCLSETGGDFSNFAKYVLKNETRSIISQYIDLGKQK